MKKIVSAIIALVVTALVAGMTAVVVGSLATPKTAASVCDTDSLHSFADMAEKNGDGVAAGIYRQWAEKCQQAKESAPAASPSTSASASPSTSPSATATLSATPPATSVEEFLANRPVNTKTSTNAYGPKTAVLPELKNKGMEDLTPEQAKAELIYVSEVVDRMQTADKALDLGIIAKNGDKNQVNDLTERFVRDRAYWDQIRKQVGDRLRELTPSIETVKPGTIVGMSYSVPGTVPQIGSSNVSFGYVTKWIVLKDAKGNVVAKYRLLCHFQHGNIGQDIPTPPPGTGITPEGEPTILVDVCRLVNGDWKKVYNVEKKQGDLPLNSPKCNPSTPTPTPTPTGTPTSTPTPSTTPTPTPTPTCREKECQTPPSPPPSYTPAPSPTGPEESEPPVEPTPAQPSDKPGDPVDIPAPGTTDAPKPEKPAPTVTNAPEPSAPVTTDPDPDGNG